MNRPCKYCHPTRQCQLCNGWVCEKHEKQFLLTKCPNCRNYFCMDCNGGLVQDNRICKNCIKEVKALMG